MPLDSTYDRCNLKLARMDGRVGVGWVATGVAPSPDREDEWAGGSAADDFFSLWSRSGRGDGETRKQSGTQVWLEEERGGWPPARNGRRAAPAPIDAVAGRPATYVRTWMGDGAGW